MLSAQYHEPINQKWRYIYIIKIICMTLKVPTMSKACMFRLRFTNHCLYFITKHNTWRQMWVNTYFRVSTVLTRTICVAKTVLFNCYTEVSVYFQFSKHWLLNVVDQLNFSRFAVKHKTNEYHKRFTQNL